MSTQVTVSPLFDEVNKKAMEYQAASGSKRQELFEELVNLIRAQANYLVWQSLHQERADIVQDTLAIVLLGKWSGEAPFSAYVAGIVKRLCRKYYRRKRNEMLRTVSLTPPDGYDEESWAAQNGLLVQPLLPPNLDAFGFTTAEREVVELRYAGFSYFEIATKTQRGIGTVSTLLYRARRKLLEVLSKN